ncbi:26S proteasome regulatory subunit N8 [Nematocida homosporus]|uniref:26S proteasome regulatory subunit N8 n=1 Tax=Nematocida homosporus TaxID=1912981 RepID=UPI0022208DD5|nr:26S proteasome regulatory subunit N8 [Nematocida homosporus]KAI5187123.1 26S proteasome regulatory subunit N8 [Nematocida homosporus]
MHAFKKVVVHPLVLLSAVDHYRRMDQPRVVGTLLGRIENGVVHITNSYAVPFDEVEGSSGVWFFDTSYNDSMYKLFNKVNSMEVILGWYHTGVDLHKNDLQITQTFQTYTKDPILAVIDVEHSSEGTPVKCYRLEKEIKSSTETAKFVFAHAPFEIEAEEAEEVGVEQLIEDVRDVNIGDLGHKIARSTAALQDLASGLQTIENYLLEVETGKRDYNEENMQLLQEMLNNVPRTAPAQISEYIAKMEANSYLCAVVRSIVLLNDVTKSK